jgi:hypothetical protein
MRLDQHTIGGADRMSIAAHDERPDRRFDGLARHERLPVPPHARQQVEHPKKGGCPHVGHGEQAH